jgi:hypothetical protein
MDDLQASRDEVIRFTDRVRDSAVLNCRKN